MGDYKPWKHYGNTNDHSHHIQDKKQDEHWKEYDKKYGTLAERKLKYQQAILENHQPREMAYDHIQDNIKKLKLQVREEKLAKRI